MPNAFSLSENSRQPISPVVAHLEQRQEIPAPPPTADRLIFGRAAQQERLDQQDDLPDSPVQTEREFADRLHPTVYLIAVAGFAWIMAMFWVAFGSATEGAFMLAISTVYLLVYFGIQGVALGLNRLDPGKGGCDLSTFLRQGLDTWTGPLSGSSALGQVVLIPLALALGTSFMALTVLLLR